MKMSSNHPLSAEIKENVARALREDIGAGDITGQLIPTPTMATATIHARESMTMAGRPWVDEVCRQVDSSIEIGWHADDGDEIAVDGQICSLRGPARSILAAERTALNFLQLLSATATATADYVRAVSATRCRILDTRKTIPGLRLAQKYAVKCGGGLNHRIGLFDAVLIKENHIVSAGGIAAAIRGARLNRPDMPVEIEVESIAELREALSEKAERLLLDNFSTELLNEAVTVNRAEGDSAAELEASGGITLDEIASIASTGVDYISIGALTKNIRAIDLSMRFE
jgi:nicotinate-nucleotide pyrophosphorylase (carboxylating)